MQPQDPSSSAANQQIKNPLAVMQEGEQVICEIKRHPVGMIGIYTGAGFILIILAILAFVVAPSVITSTSRSHVMALGAIVFILAALLCLLFVFISNIVYWGNHWVVTSDSITQIRQTSLFDKQSSQLSLGNLEDVTSTKNGILAQMFNYGILNVETAGERSKFQFPFCPNPNYYAQCILDVREKFELAHHGGKQPPQALATPRTQGLNNAATSYLGDVASQYGDYNDDHGVNINTEG